MQIRFSWAITVEGWLDQMIEIADRDDLDPMVAPARYGNKPIVGGGDLGRLGGAVTLAELSGGELVALERLAAARLRAVPAEPAEVAND